MGSADWVAVIAAAPAVEARPPIAPIPLPAPGVAAVTIGAACGDVPPPTFAPPKSERPPVDWTGTRIRRRACGSERRSAAYRRLMEKRARPAIAVDTGMPP